MILLILFEKSHKHAKINKFVFVLTFGEANLEIDIYIYIYIYISFNLGPSKQKFLIIPLDIEANKFLILPKD